MVTCLELTATKTEKFSAYSNSRPDLFFFHLKRGIGGIVDSSKALEEDQDQDLVGYITEHKGVGGEAQLLAGMENWLGIWSWML